MIAKLAYESAKILRYKEQNPELLQSNEKLLLVGGLNDTVSFQFIFCPEKDSYGFAVSGEPTFLASGAFDSFRVETTTNGDFEVSQQIIGFNDDNDGTLYGDILLNDSNIYIENRHQISSAFISINIAKNAKHGDYKGEVKLYCRNRTENERLMVSLPFNFTIFDKTIPSLAESSFFLDLWQHNCNIARKHETRLWSDEHFAIMEKYVASLAELGQKSITIVASEAPWNGQSPEYSREYISNFYEYSIIEVRREPNGKFTLNFNFLERLLQMYFRNGIDSEIQIFGLMSVWQNSPDRWETCCESHPIKCRVRYYDVLTREYCFMREKEEIDFYISEIYYFFDKNNLLEKTRIASDEPHDKREYQEQLNYYAKNFPKFKFKTAFSDGKLACELNEMDDKSVLLTELVKNLQELKQNKKPNGKLLMYTCGLPAFPNTFIRCPLLESRLLPILCEFLGLDGYLRWSYTAWANTPRQRLAYRWSSGDTCLVYPSNGGDVLLSLRYKNLKRGLEEVALLKSSDIKTRDKYFDYLILLKEPSKFYQQESSFYEKDPFVFAQAKKYLLENI